MNLQKKTNRFLWNIFLSGFPADYDLEVLRKLLVLNILNIFGCFFLVLLGFTEFVLRDHLLGATDLSLVLLLFWLFIYLRKTGNHNLVSWIGVTITGIFFSFLIAYGGKGQTAYVWAFLYPLVAISLLGPRRGTVFSLILLVMACIVFIFGKRVAFFVSYSPYLKIRFIPAYLAIFIFSFVIEKIQQIVQDRLKSAKLEVEKTVGELEKANNALQESELKYRTFFSTSRDCVFISSWDGRLLDVNDAAADFFGYKSTEELQKVKIVDLYENPEERTNAINILMKKGFAKEYPVKLKKKDGSIIHALLTTVPKVDEDGKIIAFQGTIRDVTEKMAIEEQLHQAQKLEAIGALAGGVAHDLNNILSGIVGYPDLILLQLPKNSPLRKPILAIQESGNKAAAIVRDLLTLARRGVATYEVINLNNIISEYLQSPEYGELRLLYPDIEIQTRKEADLLNIFGSPIHILNIVTNLVFNAAEAIAGNGKISISTENRYIDRPIGGYEDVKEGDYVTFTVSDSGTGINPADMKKIFDPFYTKKKMGKSGTGLGLTVVRGTVKDHKGYIDVQSAQGRGTTFILYFPVTRKALDRNQAGLSIKDYMGMGQSILVIDDVEEQRALLSEMLNTLGYSVTAVPSGEEALKYLQTCSIDLLILDMIMEPGMDGLDTYRKIIKLHPGQKAIIASGYSESERVKKAQELGARQYIRKPYTLEKIGLAVKEELTKKIDVVTGHK